MFLRHDKKHKLWLSSWQALQNIINEIWRAPKYLCFLAVVKNVIILYNAHAKINARKRCRLFTIKWKRESDNIVW